MLKINTNETLDTKVIQKLINRYRTHHLCIVMDNTKNQSPKLLEEIAINYPQITISVTGGLNPRKQKYDEEHYQQRTYYSPMELSKIIKIFQSIERKIDISWTDTQKAMFVYQELYKHMMYDEIEVNGRDCARNLSGLLYGKAVCAGFAMIFKEAMDRLGILCAYQNMQHHHAWNIVYLDGVYRAVELTWEVSNKKTESCPFRFFGEGQKFYQNPHRNIDYEKEETEYKLTPISESDKSENKLIINKPKATYISLRNNKTNIISLNGVPVYFETTNGKLRLIGKNNKVYRRRNGKEFIIVFAGTKYSLNKFYYFEEYNGMITKNIIYSENRLDLVHEADIEALIADGLLSEERVNRKINNFNGYVGFIGKEHAMYYDEDIERRKLNIIR
ncbi:MAG: hypothetical protein VZS44_02250 [Bacilli bacterium]|nr:hypothetical protein [Bacilli bacterium]